MGVRFIHVVWSPAIGPIAAYENPSIAYGHASSMLGVDVASLKIESRLPSIVLDDLERDFDDDDTPIDRPPIRVPARLDSNDTIVVDFDDVDD